MGACESTPSSAEGYAPRKSSAKDYRPSSNASNAAQKLLKRLPSNRASVRSTDTNTAHNQSNTSLISSSFHPREDGRRSNGSDCVDTTTTLRASNAPPGNRTSLPSRASLTSATSIPENEQVVRPRPLSIKSQKQRRPPSIKMKTEGTKLDELILLYEHEEMDFDFIMSQLLEPKRTPAQVATLRATIAKSKKTNVQEDDDEEAVENKQIEATASNMNRDDNEEAAAPLEKPKLTRGLSQKAKRGGRSFFKSRTKSYVAAEALDAQDPIAITDGMFNLLTCIAHAETRKKLIHQLMAIKGGLSVQVRFIAAVEQYENTTNDLAEQRRLGEQIIAIFVEDDMGRFAVTLREETRKYLAVEGFLNFLPYAKMEVLESLAKREDVMEMIGEGGRTVRKTKSTASMPSED